MRKVMLHMILCVCVVFCLSGCSILFMTDVPVSKSNREQIKSFIYDYVVENEQQIILAAQSAQLLADDAIYIRTHDDSGVLYAWKNATLMVEPPITEETIKMVFDGGVDLIDLQNAVTFHMGGMGNVTNSIYTGFYYSEDDVPLWINTSVEFMHYPMIEQGIGWVADKSYCSDASMKHYQLYTEKIVDYIFYFELQL